MGEPMRFGQGHGQSTPPPLPAIVAVLLWLVLAGLAGAASQARVPKREALVMSFPEGATVARAGQPVVGVQKGTLLEPTDLVTAGPNGSVDLRLADLGMVRIKPNTKLDLAALFQKLQRDPQAEETRLRLDAGTVLVRLRSLKGQTRFLIDTPSAITAARGTAFIVDATAQSTEVLVGEGKVAVSRPNMLMPELAIGEQQKTRVRVGQPLPGAPVAVTDPDKERLKELDDLAHPGGEVKVDRSGDRACLAVSLDGKVGVIGTNNDTVLMFNTRTGKTLKTFARLPQFILSVALSRDGGTVYAGGVDAKVHAWSVESGEEIFTLPPHPNPTTNLAVSPDGRYLLVNADDLYVWDLTTREPVIHLTTMGNVGGVGPGSFSPDMRYVIGPGNRCVYVWELATGRSVMRLAAPADVLRAAISADNRYVLGGCKTGVMLLWDLPTGKPIKVFATQSPDLRGVAFLPDGRRAISGGDRSMRLWDLATGRELARYDLAKGSVADMRLSPDGRHAYALCSSAGFDFVSWWLPEPTSP